MGTALPKKVLTNFDLEKLVDTSDEWITTRTGIKERRIVDNNTATSDLVVDASKRAIKEAGINPEDIDMLIVATDTPDNAYPSTACWVQKGLRINSMPAVDIVAGCTGWLYGLELASGLLSTGGYKNILVAGGEVMSKVVNWEDRATCVLFGDGAGATIVSPTDKSYGLLSCVLGADGNLGELLVQPAGGTRLPASEETVKKKLHTVRMQGNEVFKHAVRRMGEAAFQALKIAGVSSKDISLFIPHQANIRIIEATCKRTGIPLEKTYNTIQRYGNMSAASLPVTLAEAKRDGRIKEGDLILFAAFGAGFTWGAAVLRWGSSD